jgi:hypothetical protein
MRKLHSGALDMIECHHGVPLDTECPKCMEVDICGADAPPELTDKETILMARIAELEKLLQRSKTRNMQSLAGIAKQNTRIAELEGATYIEQVVALKARIEELEGALEKIAAGSLITCPYATTIARAALRKDRETPA